MTTVIIQDPHAVQDSEDREAPGFSGTRSTAGCVPATSSPANSSPAGCTPFGRAPARPVIPHPYIGLVCRPFAPGDLPAVLAMLGRCSRETLFRRFHGATDGTFHALDLASRGDHQTLGAWVGSECVGIASLIPGTDTSDPDPCYLDSRDPDLRDLGHLGVLVEDGWQRRGVGNVLLNHLADCARAVGVSAMHADVLAENRWAIRMLSQFGTVYAHQSWGVYSATVTLS